MVCDSIRYKVIEIIKKFKPSLIKIPSTISTYKSFHEYLSINYRGSIVISTDLLLVDEDYILNKFKRTKNISITVYFIIPNKRSGL